MNKWKSSSKKRSKLTQKDAQGRVHLLLQKDASGAVQISLKAPLFREPWQNSLTLHTVVRALQQIEPGFDTDALAQLAHSATQQHEHLLKQLFEQNPNAKVACRAGCDHCCHQSVGVTPVEALSIVQFLRVHCSPAELQATTERVHAAYLRTRGLSADERYSADHPCVFLKQGTCSVYQVRPLSCRGANSLDAEECRTSLLDPEARARFLSAGGGGKSYQEPVLAFHAISAGLQLALSEVHHLDMRPLDLIAAMDLLLGSGSEALVQSWCSGKPAFASAYGGERQWD
jgi:Fe-S-cluster containining protein